MPYVRVSLMQPKAGHQAHVRQLLSDLADFFAKQPGFIEGYKLDSQDGLIGRVTVWDSEDAAERAAQTNHVLSVRSELNPVVDHHEEHAFEGSLIRAAG